MGHLYHSYVSLPEGRAYLFEQLGEETPIPSPGKKSSFSPGEHGQLGDSTFSNERQHAAIIRETWIPQDLNEY